METVQLQCGSCRKLMAISVAHLGGQVQCPHCRAVVQAPPRPAVAPPPESPPPVNPPPHMVERESIFAGPEDSEDLFADGRTEALVEMPPEPPPPPAPECPATVEFAAMPELRAAMTAAPPAPEPAPAAVPEFGALEDTEGESELPTSHPRPIYDKSVAGLIALIFLVPYAIVTTLYIVYLLVQLNNQPHPLDMLPDPGGKGGPRKVERIQHDYPLAAHQKAGLGDLVRVGAVEVAPQQVARTREGNLTLELRVKNISDDQVFAPISDQFLQVQSDRAGGKPYTFLQSVSFTPVYGAFLQVKKGPPSSDGALGPGQEEVLALTTMDKDQKLVRKIIDSKERLIWRVQLRRGLVAHRGKQVSATTVVGVAFNARDIK